MNKNKLIIYIILTILTISSVVNFFDEIHIIGNTKPYISLVLDLSILIIGMGYVFKNRKNITLKLLTFLFIIFSLITYLVNINTLPLNIHINGFREFAPLFLFPIIYRELFTTIYKNILIRSFNFFIYFFLIIQFPITLYQFVKFGAGDAVGGSLSNGYSGVLTIIIYI